MRKLSLYGFLLSLLVVIFTGIASEQFSVALLDLNFKRVVVNTSSHPINIYPLDSENNQVIAKLIPGASLPYLYSGKTGYWKYVAYINSQASLRDSSAHVVIKLFNTLIDQNRIISVYQYSLVALIAFTLLLLMRFKTRKKARKYTETEVESIKQFYDNQISDLNDTYSIKLRQALNTNQHYSKKIQIIESESKRIETRLKRQLERTIKAESERRYRATIEEMQNSYNVLNEKYLRVLAEAKIFGINFTDAKYENILKGRKYELCVAQALVQSGCYNILEWTPDKGIEQNIPVAANTNPDLIVEDQYKLPIAIECKYRSKYFFKKIDDDEISCGDSESILNYQTFGTKREMPVWMAIGFCGAPENPDKHYLIPLEYLIQISTDKVVDEERQTIFRESRVQNCRVSNLQYPQVLQKYIAGCLVD